MPRLRVVLLAGKDAQAAWALFDRRHGALVRSRGITVLPTYHPSRQALQHPDLAERARREEHIRTTLRRAAQPPPAVSYTHLTLPTKRIV